MNNETQLILGVICLIIAAVGYWIGIKYIKW
jgi:uncharacterized protein YneF (UPF0154 family)